MEATENNPGLVNPKILNNKKFRHHQIYVFCITAALYATLHASRTTWAYSKKSIGNDEYFTDQKLSILDTTFMISYAFGLFYSGWLGDHSALKGFLARGALISVFGFVMFTLLVTTGFHDIFVYTGLFLLSGYGQSREFPGIMAILGNWIEKSHRGVVIGAWNSCVNIGNIMGQQIGKFIIDVNYQSWSYVILTACGSIVFMVIVMLIFLKVTPKEAGLATREQDLDDISAQAEAPKLVEPDQENIPIGSSINLGAEVVLPAETMKGIGFFEALKAPGLIRYGIIYACVKSSTYGLLFWLPNYLQTIIGFGSESANITATYEFGQFLGAILLGYCSDRIGKRSIVIVIGLYLSAIIFICLTTLKAGASAWVFGGLLFLAGFLFGGPEAIIGNIVSSDIGESKSLENNARALATTVGIIDGIGAVGAAIVQLIIPYLKSHSFFLYFGLCVTAAIMITPIAIKEIKSIRKTESDHRELVEMAVIPDSEGI